MFTVLIRFRKDAHEQLFAAESVEFHYIEGLTLSFSYAKCVGEKDSESTNFAVGPSPGNEGGEPYADAYVMNKNGKTVARYVL
jgi:hypothetical protein